MNPVLFGLQRLFWAQYVLIEFGKCTHTYEAHTFALV